jgi:hypothetical protein
MAFGNKAVRSSAFLKIAIQGMSGVGKTFTALLIAAVLGKKIGLLDSEYKSALKSAGRPGIPEFQHQPMTEHSVQEYIAQTSLAAEDGIDVLIYDSWSHSWIAALEAVDAMGGNKFSNGWKAVTPLVKSLIHKMLSYPGHCIATMRLDAEWLVEKDDRGKAVPRKVGTKPVAGKGAEYEFDWVLELTPEGKVIVVKTRNGELLPLGSVHDRADLPKIAKRLVDWLNEGAPLSPFQQAAEQLRFADSLASLDRISQTVVPAHLKQHPGDRDQLLALYKQRRAALEMEKSA